MKKTRKFFVLLIVVTFALGSGIAFALTTSLGATTAYTFTDPNNVATSLTFKTSNNVQLAANTASPFTTYAAAAQHGSGDKLYGVASDSVSMYWKTSTLSAGTTATTAVAAVITATTVSSGAFSGNTWTSI